MVLKKYEIKDGLVYEASTNNLFSGLYSKEGAKGNFLNGKLDGIWYVDTNFFFDKSDEVDKILGVFQSGKINKTLKFSLRNNCFKKHLYFFETNFKNGVLHGIQKTYTLESKKLVSIENFSNWELNGEYKEFDENENLIISKNYKNGYLSGPIKIYDVKNNKLFLNGIYKTINLNNSLTAKSIRDGIWDYNYKILKNVPADQKTENLSDEDKTKKYLLLTIQNIRGESDRYKDEFCTEHFEDGEKNGLFTFYYDNGNIKQKKEFKNDFEEGLDQKFYENGQLKSQINLMPVRYSYPHRSSRHGLFESFYENGQIYQTGHYKNNFHDGKWITYEKNGKVKSEDIYDADKANRTLEAEISRSRAMSSDISDAMGGSEFMSDSEKDVFGD